MSLKQILGAGAQKAKHNSPAILATAAGVGVITTAYLSGKASVKASKIIAEDQETPYDRRKALIHNAKLVWKTYIPTGISAAATIGCIVGAQRTAGNKTLAATTALAVSERAYSAYRDKVIEEFGERKDQSIRDQVVAEQIQRDPPPAHILSGPGNVLCQELFTGRYFTSDMETLRKAQNDLNERLMGGVYCTLDEWYDLIGLDYTKASNNIGWTSDKQMKLNFSTHLSPDGRPVLAFDYNYTAQI